MPLDFHKNTEEFKLGIWRMDESMEALYGMLQLSNSDLISVKKFKSEYRKLEWLTTRVLVKELLPGNADIRIIYNEYGKPYLANSSFSISISHTKNFVAVLLAKNASAGVDLETIQSRIEKIAKKFITKQEENFIESDKKIIYQHVIWGTKEVLFKIYSKGGLNFLVNLHAKKFLLADAGELTGCIEKNNFKKEYAVFYEKRNNLMLVYAFE